jgi:twitching motility protein PilT
MSTLHTTDVVQSIQRIISFYPPHQHDEIRMGLAANLRAVVSQRLIPRRDGAGRIPAVEVMITTPTVREYILDPDKIPLLHTLVSEGVTQYGMQTFDQSVLALLREGLITEEEALRNCNNPNELTLKLKGFASTSDRTWQAVDAATGEDAGADAGMPGMTGVPPRTGAQAGSPVSGSTPARPDWMSRE